MIGTNNNMTHSPGLTNTKLSHESDAGANLLNYLRKARMGAEYIVMIGYKLQAPQPQPQRTFVLLRDSAEPCHPA